MSYAELFTRSPGENSFESYLRLIHGLNQFFPSSNDSLGLSGFALPGTHIGNEQKPGFALAGTSGFTYLGIVATENPYEKIFPESLFYYAIGEAVSKYDLLARVGNSFDWIHLLPTSNFANVKGVRVELKDAPNDIRYTLGKLASAKFDLNLSQAFAASFERGR